MAKSDIIEKVDDIIKTLDNDISELKILVPLIDFGAEGNKTTRKEILKGIKIIKKKINKIRHAENFDELSKHVKVKKIKKTINKG